MAEDIHPQGSAKGLIAELLTKDLESIFVIFTESAKKELLCAWFTPFGPMYAVMMAKYGDTLLTTLSQEAARETLKKNGWIV